MSAVVVDAGFDVGEESGQACLHGGGEEDLLVAREEVVEDGEEEAGDLLFGRDTQELR